PRPPSKLPVSPQKTLRDDLRVIAPDHRRERVLDGARALEHVGTADRKCRGVFLELFTVPARPEVRLGAQGVEGEGHRYRTLQGRTKVTPRGQRRITHLGAPRLALLAGVVGEDHPWPTVTLARDDERPLAPLGPWSAGDPEADHRRGHCPSVLVECELGLARVGQFILDRDLVAN